MKVKAAFVAALLGVGMTAAACGSSSTAASGGGGSSGGTTKSTNASSTAITFTSAGTPDLKGMTIGIGNAAGSAHIGDTNVHDLVTFLTKWGASASQTNASQNAPELAVSSGRLDVAVGPLPTEVDSGLVTFGPNQVHLDDEVLAKPSIKSLADLKGKTIAYCCTASPDGVLLTEVLQKAGLSRSDVHLLATGASTSSLNALLAGQVDAAFTAASGLPPAADKYRPLASATQLIPQYADSFMSAEGSWISSHFKEAVAVDLAWLASAKLFNTNESAWVTAAKSYTSNADSTSQYQQAWHELKTLNGWPLSESAYTAPAVAYNLSVAKQQAALQGQGTRPAAQETNTTAWAEAWKLFEAHQGTL
jgi:ABC-type nitrate/sulfonate/bicarbonate transport system substrate-binding protein